jgi:heme O synthase-like polyprenyltransferase
MKDNKLLKILPTIFNIITIIAFVLVALNVGKFASYLYVFFALIVSIPDIIMSIKLLKKNNGDKVIAIINLALSALFFISSVAILIYVLIH